ncbi:MAG: hypothetical protein IIZ68_00720 [Clostridia bacterium]|nr:hypothetical protein [Clostridia bacterium]
MDLINREAAIEALGERPENWTDTPAEIEAVRSYDNAIDDLKSVPSAPAVPLEPLAKWLAERYEPPYTFVDIDKLKIPIDFRQQKEIWMAALTKWMEEQDAADRS